MAQKIRWSTRAASNFEEICNYIAKDSEVYATIFAKKVDGIVKSIPQFPKAGRIVPEYGDENLREKIYENYRLFIALRESLLKLSQYAMAPSRWRILYECVIYAGGEHGAGVAYLRERKMIK